MSGRRTATWTGSLLGFTGAGRPVAGDAEIGIDLSSLQGRADFRELESWARETHPGATGSGLVWGDGDLRYTIGVATDAGTEVFVSTFAAGDDPGIVTGTFAGVRHEGAAGILEHPDPSAAFGATARRSGNAVQPPLARTRIDGTGLPWPDAPGPPPFLQDGRNGGSTRVEMRSRPRFPMSGAATRTDAFVCPAAICRSTSTTFLRKTR